MPSTLARPTDPRDAFLDEVAHQLRTPLTPLLMLAHLLRDATAVPEALRPQLELVRENAERLADLVEELAEIARLRRGKLSLSHEPLDGLRLVAEALAARRGEAQSRGVLVATVPAPAVRISGDGVRLRRALEAMLALAISRTPRGGIVTVESTISSAGWSLVVSDEGQPLTAEQSALLLDPLAAHAVRREAETLGAGIAIACAVAEALGGGLEIDGTGRGGARITLRLPTSR
jgi:signal transduction histidine kinase